MRFIASPVSIDKDIVFYTTHPMYMWCFVCQRTFDNYTDDINAHVRAKHKDLKLNSADHWCRAGQKNSAGGDHKNDLGESVYVIVSGIDNPKNLCDGCLSGRIGWTMHQRPAP
jgi:hypothetical protein